MQDSRWTSEREQLERELRGVGYEGMLAGLKAGEPLTATFTNWAEVIAFMQRGVSDDPRKDMILAAILRAHARDGDPRWRRVLLFSFWPGLESLLHRKLKRKWDTSPDDLWGNIVSIFLQVVCRLNLAKRSSRLAKKLINDTAHHLHDEYSRLWRMAGIARIADPKELDMTPANCGGVEFDSIDRRLRQEREVERLHKHMEAGRISEADFLLLVGTRVYGKLIREYAQEAELPFQTAKKRRQRAEAAIRRFEGAP